MDAQTLSGLINAQSREGWEYLRAETLPSEERVGFTKRQTVYLNLLVFRRPAHAEEPATPRLTLSAQSRVGEPPRIHLGEEGAAPKLGPADA